jgi:hypothetical protein
LDPTAIPLTSANAGSVIVPIATGSKNASQTAGRGGADDAITDGIDDVELAVRIEVGADAVDTP